MFLTQSNTAGSLAFCICLLMIVCSCCSAAQIETSWYSQHAVSSSFFDSEVSASFANSIRLQPETTIADVDLVGAVVASLKIHTSDQLQSQTVESEDSPFHVVNTSIKESTPSATYYQDIDRLYVEFNIGELYTVIGRQSQDWGVGRFFRPNDLFNRVSPVAIQQEERVGIDMINTVFYISNNTDIQAMVLPYRDADLAYLMATSRFRTRMDITDVILYVHHSHIQRGIGLDIESSVWDAGIRLESLLRTSTNAKTLSEFGLTLGIDNQFGDLYCALELAHGTGVFFDVYAQLFGPAPIKDRLQMVSATLSHPIIDDYTALSLNGVVTSEKTGLCQLQYTSDVSDTWNLSGGLGFVSTVISDSRIQVFALTLSGRWYH